MSDPHSSGSGVAAIAMNLTGACLLSGLIIAGTFYLTNDIAERKAAELESKSKLKLVPDADSFKEVEGRKGWSMALKGDKPLAFIVPTESKGYAGSVKLIVALSPEGKVLNFSILESKETPGLGDKASQPQFHDQFLGKDLAHLKVVKDPSDKEDILAITGATITSKAVTKAVREAIEELNKHLGARHE